MAVAEKNYGRWLINYSRNVYVDRKVRQSYVVLIHGRECDINGDKRIAMSKLYSIQLSYSVCNRSFSVPIYSSSSSPPSSSPFSAAFARFLRLRPGRPPANAEPRAKSICFCESSRTMNDGTLTTYHQFSFQIAQSTCEPTRI